MTICLGVNASAPTMPSRMSHLARSAAQHRTGRISRTDRAQSCGTDGWRAGRRERRGATRRGRRRGRGGAGARAGAGGKVDEGWVRGRAGGRQTAAIRTGQMRQRRQSAAGQAPDGIVWSPDVRALTNVEGGNRTVLPPLPLPLLAQLLSVLLPLILPGVIAHRRLSSLQQPTHQVRIYNTYLTQLQT